jgi:hypothetical protein
MSEAVVDILTVSVPTLLPGDYAVTGAVGRAGVLSISAPMEAGSYSVTLVPISSEPLALLNGKAASVKLKPGGPPEPIPGSWLDGVVYTLWSVGKSGLEVLSGLMVALFGGAKMSMKKYAKEDCCSSCPRAGRVFYCKSCGFTLVVIQDCCCADPACVCISCCGTPLSVMNPDPNAAPTGL